MVAFCCNELLESEALSKMIQDNEDILRISEQLGCKQYLPKHQHISQWRHHFGSKWAMFVQNELVFDPRAILAPSHNLFKAGAHFNQYLRFSRN